MAWWVSRECECQSALDYGEWPMQDARMLFLTSMLTAVPPNADTTIPTRSLSRSCKSRWVSK
jgi:hypothetical protein